MNDAKWWQRPLINLRNRIYEATDTDTGQTATYEIVIDKGISADWSSHRYRGGMGIPGAWRASLITADLLGSMPWDAYRRRAGRPVEPIDPTPILLEQPFPEEELVDTFGSLALDLVWEGNAVGIIADRNRAGWPTAILPVPAHMVSARRVGPGANAGGLPVGRIEYAIGGRTFDKSDIMHIKGPHAPGDLRGMGIIEMHLDGTLALAKEQQDQAKTLSRHGVPTGLLRVTNPDAKKKDLEDAKAAWLKSQRERTVAALNAVTEFQPLSWNPEELQLVEARKFSLHEIALIFGLPLSFLGADQSSRTYRNSQDEALDLLKFGAVGGHIRRFEQTLTRMFPRGTTVKGNLDFLLRADTLTRYQAHAVGIDKGFLTVNEVRALEDLPPLPEPPEPPEPPEEDPDIVDAEVVEPLELEQGRASQLQVGEGRKLWQYWTKGEGLAKWAGTPHPYTALTTALKAAGVPAHSVPGLAANMFKAVFGIWPGERKGENPVGRG